MNTSTAPYVVERRVAEEAAWSPISYCRSLEYAEMIAGIGVRRRIGVMYRAIDLRTGAEAALVPDRSATAVS